MDCVIEVPGGIVLVRRADPPEGWALPGGFVEADETVEEAAVREALEETGIAVTLEGLLGVYSEPGRDPRGPTVSVVFVGRGEGTPRGGSDAAWAGIFDPRALPRPMAFDHERIVRDYLAWRRRRRAARLFAAAGTAAATAVTVAGIFRAPFRRGSGGGAKKDGGA